MDLYRLLACLAGVFVLIQFAALPVVEALIRRTVSSKLIACAVLMSTLHVARTVVLIATISAALAVATVWLIGLTGGGTVATVTATLERLQVARRILLQIDPFLAFVSVVVLSGAMVLLARRQAKIGATAAFNEAITLEVERVLDDGRNGRWPELPPNPAIEAIRRDMASLAGDREILEADLRAANASVADAEPESLARQAHKRSTESARNRIERIDEQLLKMQQAILHEELGRRMDVRFDPTTLIPRAPDTWSGRLATLFASRGVLRTLRGASRVAFAAALALLVPSMLTLAAPALDAAVSDRIEAVEQLQVELDRKDAVAAVEQLKETQEQNELAAQVELSTVDVQVLDAIGRQYELALGRHYARLLDLPEPARAGSIADEVGRQHARDLIVGAEAQRVAVQVGDIPPADRQMAELARAAAASRAPVTPGGREYRDFVDSEVRQAMPHRWQGLRQAMMDSLASLRTMPEPGELRGMLVSSIIHTGTGGISPELGQLAAKIEVTWLEQARQAQTARLTLALASGQPPRAAFDDFGKPRWHVSLPDPATTQLRIVADRTPGEDEVLRRAQGFHSGFAPKAGANDIDPALARYINVTFHDGEQHRPPEAILGFDDHFPGTPPPAPSSGRKPPLGPEPPPGPGPLLGGGGGVAREVASAERVAMSRSFSRLLGFSRVGGVLIGRPPDGNPHLDVTSFDWRRDGEVVRLTLGNAGGKSVNLGPFQPEVVHLALAYAADGRPVTATMVTASPLRELKILLHPALEDTALGCRAIEVDRLVDRFAGSSDDVPTLRDVETDRVYGYLELYRWAWAVTVAAAVAAPDNPAVNPRATWVLRSLGRDATDYLDQLAANPDSDAARLLSNALRERAHLRDPQYSPLTAKTDYFAPQQVDRLASCAGITLDATRRCLEHGADALRTEAGDLPRLAWSTPPPMFTVWSGVREAPFQGDADLAFADPSRSPQAAMPFAPLSFILQVAFTSKPYVTDAKHPWYELNGDAMDAVSDEHPWQFPRLQAWIDHQVAEGIRSAPDAQETFGVMREFTALQRLFRLGLSGDLGSRFPVDRLTALASASRGWVRSGVRTHRWNARPGSLEAQALGAAKKLSEMEQVSAPLRGAAAQCVGAFAPMLRDPEGEVRLAAVSSADWAASCPIQGASMAATDPDAEAAVRTFMQVSAARDLRRTLGVNVDDQAILASEQRCPPF